MESSIERLIEAIEGLTEELRYAHGCDCGSHECGELTTSYGRGTHVDPATQEERAVWAQPVFTEPHCRDDLECYEGWEPEGV